MTPYSHRLSQLSPQKRRLLALRLGKQAASIPQAAGDQRLVAYVVPQAGGALAVTELRSFLSEKLPSYMVPSNFVVLDALPLTPNGKLDRRALPDPEELRPESEDGFVEPRTEIERAVARIWAGLLGFEPIGVQDDFFELGGHSLLVTRMIAHLRDLYGLDIPVAAFFQVRTVAGLAAYIETLSWANRDRDSAAGDRDEIEF